MASSNDELEQQLVEAGNRLLQSPSSVDELLPLLDEVFQLIVSSFENLSDKSSRSYAKRTSILETVAKVRSCVVMLDLECDTLIIEMFRHFLKTIRDYHPENVFSSMETIMTLVVEESEDISIELLLPILECLRKENKEVLPIARKLGERVLEACAAKLRPYLLEAVKSTGISLEDYSTVVASIYQESAGSVDQNDVSNELKVDENESKSLGASVDVPDQVGKEIAREAASTEEIEPANDSSSKSVVNNGVTQSKEDDSSKKEEHVLHDEQFKSVDTSSNAEPDISGTDKVVNAECKSEQTTKRRGRKPSSLVKMTEPSNTSNIDCEKEVETLRDHKSGSKDVPSSPPGLPSVGEAVSLETEKETIIKISSPKPAESESIDAVSPSASGGLPNEGRAQRSSRAKRKESLKEATPSADDVSRKASEGTSDSEAKPHKQLEKKVLTVSGNEDEIPTGEGSKKESGTLNDSEAKLFKSAKKVHVSSNNGDRSMLKRKEKAISGKDLTKSLTKEDKELVSSPKSAAKPIKDQHHSEDTPKTNSKRKQTPGKEKGTDTKEFGENLVGSRVKIWWPKDRMFYKGVIKSFDSTKKKHKVHYDDGDKETLNLKREKWELIDNDSDEDQATDSPSPDASSEMPLKKKLKTSSDQSTKQGKTDASPKRVGGASSSKSKGESLKSSRKSKEESKVDGKSRDGSKSITKLENENVLKSKDHASKSGSTSVDVSSKSASKSKNDAIEIAKSSKSKEGGSGTPKTTTKSKQDTPKTGKSRQESPKISSIVKAKSPRTVGKSTANGKSKSSSSKLKEIEDVKDSPDSGKVSESTKGKSSSPSKIQGSETKTGKKRQRGSKS
ncbi:muscle M-line assembly protein unc-89 isoform X2 [Mangifera indica]|uniref:muscle M-line assembly protein unc-89 isoform X2 n=1 Tax=Mangifera indica TaxID=29780 RepID=UPI001CFBFA4C|nr:muscle M-line assembly protein unc-89 isoform X2 [Mangifera indica]